MKGIVFTELLKMIEEVFSLEMADKIINESNLPSKGIYTTVGTYDYKEIIELVSHLSQETGIPVPELEVTYGQYLFKSFTKHYGSLMAEDYSFFTFLTSVNDVIHVDVKKLYPDAELPHLAYQQVNDKKLILDYRSSRNLSALAEGLIKGSAEYFGVNIKLSRENFIDNDKNVTRFIIEEI